MSSLEEKLNQIDKENHGERCTKNLLLGNGYSIAASTNFAYKNLYERTDFQKIQPIKKYLKSITPMTLNIYLKYYITLNVLRNV